MDIAIVLIELLIAIVWIQQGIVRYDFWLDGAPGGGFVPVVFSALILTVSLAILFREILGKKKTQDSYRFKPESYLPAVAAVLGVFMIQVLGILLAVFLFTTIWMHYLSRYSWAKTLLSSLIFSVFIYGVFRMWLNVPFPTGFIYRFF